MDAKVLWEAFRLGMKGGKKCLLRDDVDRRSYVEYQNGWLDVVEALIEHILEQHEPKWEYRVETVSTPMVSGGKGNQALQERLNAYGSKGWEVVSVTPWESGAWDFREQGTWNADVVLKRRLPPPTANPPA